MYGRLTDTEPEIVDTTDLRKFYEQKEIDIQFNNVLSICGEYAQQTNHNMDHLIKSKSHWMTLGKFIEIACTSGLLQYRNKFLANNPVYDEYDIYNRIYLYGVRANWTYSDYLRSDKNNDNDNNNGNEYYVNDVLNGFRKFWDYLTNGKSWTYLLLNQNGGDGRGKALLNESKSVSRGPIDELMDSHLPDWRAETHNRMKQITTALCHMVTEIVEENDQDAILYIFANNIPARLEGIGHKLLRLYSIRKAHAQRIVTKKYLKLDDETKEKEDKYILEKYNNFVKGCCVEKRWEITDISQLNPDGIECNWDFVPSNAVIAINKEHSLGLQYNQMCKDTNKEIDISKLYKFNGDKWHEEFFVTLVASRSDTAKRQARLDEISVLTSPMGLKCEDKNFPCKTSTKFNWHHLINARYQTFWNETGYEDLVKSDEDKGQYRRVLRKTARSIDTIESGEANPSTVNPKTKKSTRRYSSKSLRVVTINKELIERNNKRKSNTKKPQRKRRGSNKDNENEDNQDTDLPIEDSIGKISSSIENTNTSSKQQKKRRKTYKPPTEENKDDDTKDKKKKSDKKDKKKKPDKKDKKKQPDKKGKKTTKEKKDNKDKNHKNHNIFHNNGEICNCIIHIFLFCNISYCGI